MIKKILISSITFYKIFISVFLNSVFGIKSNCRFVESCSDYSKRVIYEKGAIIGLGMSIKRIIMCQPFYKGSLNSEVAI